MKAARAMRWRLGYHLAGTTAGIVPGGFGHFGCSGAWADPDPYPESELAARWCSTGSRPHRLATAGSCASAAPP